MPLKASPRAGCRIRARISVGAALTVLSAALAAQDFSHPEDTHTAPSPQAALIEQANAALTRADYPTALKLLAALNTQTPNEPHILYNLAYTEDALDHTPEAAADYRRSIAADPAFPDPHVGLGLLLARTGKPAEAATELRAATALPADPALKGQALRALAHLDPPAAAAEDLLAALKLTPETPADILLAADLASASGDLPAAEQAYRRFLAVPGNANDAEAAAALAHTLLAQHRPAEAESLLAPALAAHPGDPTLTAQLALTYLASPDPEKTARAVPLVESLHAAHPDDAAITRLLARLEAESGHTAEADTLYQALIAAAQNPDPTLLDARAELLIRLHRPGEAETLLKRATADPAAFPSPAAYAEALTHLAFAASEIDDPKITLQALKLRATVLPPSASTLFLEAAAADTLHQSTQAVDLYKAFLVAAAGNLPQQEAQARQRLALLQHRK